MPHNRYYIDAPLLPSQLATLEDKEAHHILSVMRKKTSEPLELVNGQNQLAVGKIERIDKKRVEVRIESVEDLPPKTRPMILCQAFTRMPSLEWIIEKATELGVHAFWLFPGQQSEKKEINAHQIERLRAIVIGAMKQCGRLDLPPLILKPSLLKWDSLPCDPTYFGDVSPLSPRLSESLIPKKNVAVVIGPESGFSENEISCLQNLGAQGVSLHPLVLRAETAPLVALSLLSQQN